MKTKGYIFLSIVFSLLWVGLVSADSPPNPTSDVLWTDTGGVYDPGNGIYAATFNGPVDIEAAFNNARRDEESQLGLAANALGDLSLPAGWASMSIDNRALFIINAERTARAGLSASVIGLPFTAIQSNIDGIAQYYADYLVDNNASGHDADGYHPHERIDNDPMLGSCHEFINRSENIAAFWTSGNSNALPVERAIYGWIYEDSIQSWGHREAVLLQDDDLGNQGYGFTNNYGDAGSEGFVGIGFAESPTYDPYNFGFSNMGTVVVMNIFDPIDDPNCDYGISPTAITLAGASTTGQQNHTAVWIGVILTLAMALIFGKGLNVQPKHANEEKTGSA